jgi:hypothetical protein
VVGDAAGQAQATWAKYGLNLLALRQPTDGGAPGQRPQPTINQTAKQPPASDAARISMWARSSSNMVWCLPERSSSDPVNASSAVRRATAVNDARGARRTPAQGLPRVRALRASASDVAERHAP